MRRSSVTTAVGRRIGMGASGGREGGYVGLEMLTVDRFSGSKDGHRQYTVTQKPASH